MIVIRLIAAYTLLMLSLAFPPLLIVSLPFAYLSTRRLLREVKVQRAEADERAKMAYYRKVQGRAL